MGSPFVCKFMRIQGQRGLPWAGDVPGRELTEPRVDAGLADEEGARPRAPHALKGGR